MKNQRLVHRLSYAEGGIRAAPREAPHHPGGQGLAAAAVQVASIAALLIGRLTLAVGLHLSDKA